jgi:hypothetical protein
MDLSEDGAVLNFESISEERMNERISAERVYVADVPKEMPHRYFECTLGIGPRHCLLPLLLAERSIIAVPPANTVERSFAAHPDRASQVLPLCHKTLNFVPFRIVGKD